MNRTKDKNEPVWALCDFIANAPNKEAAGIRFDKCAAIYYPLGDTWAINQLANASNNWEE